MRTWREFETERPEMAAIGRSLLYEVGSIGLGFLATVREDGGPRVHPICPFVANGGLYAFIIPGPKRDDLRRDGRYALNSETCPPPRQDDAFNVTGMAVLVEDAQLRRSLTQVFLDERDLAEPWADFDDQELFELTLDRCLLTLTQPHGDFPTGHTVWRG